MIYSIDEITFLLQMVETGVLKSFTFLYSENYSYIEDDYGNVMNAIEDFKVFIFRLFQFGII